VVTGKPGKKTAREERRGTRGVLKRKAPEGLRDKVTPGGGGKAVKELSIRLGQKRESKGI